MRKKIVAGNWKMNTLPAEGVELAKAVAARRHETDSSVELIVCPPFTHLSEVVKATRGKGVAVGAQNCAAEEKGAYTGEVSAAMLAALGVEYVILGHSERREYYGETSATLNRKLAMAYANNLIPIYCVDEKLEEREAGRHFDIVGAQLREVVYNLTPEQFTSLVVAYEPVWAPTSVGRWPKNSALPPTPPRYSTAARANPPTPRNSSQNPMWTAVSSAERPSKRIRSSE